MTNWFKIVCSAGFISLFCTICVQADEASVKVKEISTNQDTTVYQ